MKTVNLWNSLPNDIVALMLIVLLKGSSPLIYYNLLGGMHVNSP